MKGAQGTFREKHDTFGLTLVLIILLIKFTYREPYMRNRFLRSKLRKLQHRLTNHIPIKLHTHMSLCMENIFMLF